jgi:hypothetical protein
MKRSAYFAHRDHLVRGIVITWFGASRSERSDAWGTQGALMNFKRVLKCTGHTEPEIHRIIPVQPRSYLKKWKADGKAEDDGAPGAAGTASVAAGAAAEPKPT